MNDVPGPVDEPLKNGMTDQVGADTAKSDGSTEQKLQFLYKALDDSQSVIRFLDAKAAFAVALLSAMTGKVLSDLPFYFPLVGQPVWRKALLFCFWAAVALSGFVVFRVIFPVTNPAANVNLIPTHCTPQFFVWELKPKSWQRIFSRAPRFSRLALGQEAFLQDIKDGTPDSLLRCVAGEVLKVSYIRQIKADRLGALAWLLFFTSFLFVVLVTAQSLAPKISVPQSVKVEGVVEVHDKANDQQTPVLAPGKNQIPSKRSPRGLTQPHKINQNP